jgi:endonuclease YncB( thermonuclease family)
MRRSLACISRYLYQPCYSNERRNNNPDEETKEEPIPEVKNIEWKDCHPFVPPITQGYVIKVYDGDTITIASKLPYPESLLYKFSVRLNGIDAPEIKGKNEDEKQAAQLSKKALENLILHRDVLLKNCQTEKYGRILADVYLEELHLNEWMLLNKYAVSYDGGTKKSPKSWLDFSASNETKKEQKPKKHT